MRLSKLGVVAVGCGLLFGACVDAEDETLSESSAAVTAKPGRYLVVFKSETAPADAGARIKKAGGNTKKLVGKIGVASFDGTAAAAAKLRTDPAVLSVGVEHVNALPRGEAHHHRRNPPIGQPTAIDELYGFQWDIRRIGAPAVWARSQSGARPKVAVLDTGVMTTHSDLVGQVCGEKRFTYCETSTPWPSPAYPAYDTLIDFDAYPVWDPSVDPCSPAPLAFQSHGTHVSGTIAGKIGGGLIVGVAPNACVGAYKVFDRYRYTDVDGTLVDDYGAFDGPLFAAIVDATDSGYGVISMSLGGVLDLDNPEHLAGWEAWKRVTNYANRKGAVVIAAAGNDGLDLSGNLANVPSDLPHVISVAATGASLVNTGTAEFPYFDATPSSDVLAFYSNFGKPVDISAPGGDCGPGFPATCDFQHLIVSSFVFETGNELPGVPAGAEGYSWFAGTSMATPHVAAVAAQVRALHPNWDPSKVRQHLKDKAQHIGPRYVFGAGMLDANRSVR